MLPNIGVPYLWIWPLCLVSINSACGLPWITMDNLRILVSILSLLTVAKQTNKTFYCNDSKITEFEMIDTENSFTAYVIKVFGVVCVQLAHFGIGDWKDISIAHVIIIIKSEVSTFPIVIIFSVIVCLRCLLHHILLLIAYTFRENRKFVFIIIVQFMLSANGRIRFGLKVVFVYLYIAPSEVCLGLGHETMVCAVCLSVFLVMYQLIT